MIRNLALSLTLVVGIAVTAAAQTPPPPPEPKVTIGARVQFRWTLDDREDFTADTTGAGLNRDDGPFSQFDVPRLRLSLSGGAFRPWLRYLFQVDFSRTGGEGGSRIKDAIIEFRPVDRNFRVSAGQFKAPFGLQQITSSGRLQFVDRAITDAKFNPGRDMGVMFSGSAGARRFGYDLGLFNGSGESVRQNTKAHLWVARAYVQPFGAYTLSESAVDAGDKAVLHVGLAARGGKQIRGRTPTGVIEDADDQSALGVELAFKAPRFYSTAEYFFMKDEQHAPLSGRDIDSRGFHVQGGYMVLPRRLEFGALYGWVNPDTGVDNATTNEWRGVIGYYWQAHNLKLQADAGRLTFEPEFASLSARARQGLPTLGTRLSSGRRLSDTQIRVQLQLAF